VNVKAKTSLILIGTLIIGVAIGGLGSGLLRGDRARELELMRPQHRFLQFMKRVVRPTAEQSQQFDDILAKYSKQISTIHEQHQEEIFAVYDSLHKELNSLLTEEQRARLEDNLKRGHNRRVNMIVGRLTEELNLSENQSKRIEEILRANDFDPDRRRDFRRRKEDFRDELKTRSENVEREIADVLTPEQLQKYRETRRRRQPFMGEEPPPPPRDGEMEMPPGDPPE
jgi:hypothetical protein